MAEVIMPKMGDAMTEGTLLQWTMSTGATVKNGDVIAEIETDKSNVEIEAEDDGILTIHTAAGTTVPVGTVIALIGDGKAVTKEAVAASSATHAAPAQPKVPASVSSHAVPARANINGSTSRLMASHLARKIAKDKGIDISSVRGTGPNGRIIKADIVELMPSRTTPTPSVSTPTAQSAPAANAGKPLELSAIRKVIAKRMVESKTTIPHFYVMVEVDMGEAVLLREKLNNYDGSLAKISLNDMVVKACAVALKKVPEVNAAFQNDTIYQADGVHVGIAVALEDGLIVPVIRDADKLPLRKLAQTSRELIAKARDKKLKPSEYSGGSFTVSNLGTFDVDNFIAIIDPSQGAILAVSSIVKKPVVLDDGVTIAVRQRMNVTFSGDHRVMDGASGAKFTQELKRVLQNPLALLEG